MSTAFDTLTTSASGIETHEYCPRKQWASKTLRLPEPSSSSRAFGTVTHAVLRRWLEADDLGRVTASFTEGQTVGAPVDLYPAGTRAGETAWWRVEERPGQWVELNPSERDILPKLVDQAIREGLISRWPGRKMEHRFGAHWDGDPPIVLVENYRGMRVCLHGYIDLRMPRSVVDYKTTKSRRWALSPNKLRSSTQMLIYAGVILEENRLLGLDSDEEVWLFHLTLCRDPTDPFVRKTPAEVPVREVRAAWQRFAAEARQMVDIHLDFPAQQITRELALRGAAAPGDEHWFNVPGPRTTDACNKYGGCPRQQVCTGRDSVANHRATMLSLGNTSSGVQMGIDPAPLSSSSFSASIYQVPQTPTQGHNQMGILKDRLASGPPSPLPSAPSVSPPMPPANLNYQAPSSMPPAFPGTPAAAGVVAPPPLAAPRAAAPPPATVAPMKVAPTPWAFAGCTACSTGPHPGLNTKGGPCRICDSEQAKAGGATSSLFDVALAHDTVSWSLKPGAASPEWVSWAQQNGLQLQGHSQIPALSGAGVPRAEEAKPAKKKGRPKKVAEQAPSGDEWEDEEHESKGSEETGDEPLSQMDEPEAAEAPAGSLEEIVRGPKRSRGNPGIGWRLYLGCAPQKGTASRQAIRFEEVFERLCSALAGAAGKGYFELDTWKRREQLASKAAEIAAIFHADKADVVVAMQSPEMGLLLAALRPHASEVIEAVGR
jgi:hypothetical protein